MLDRSGQFSRDATRQLRQGTEFCSEFGISIEQGSCMPTIPPPNTALVRDVA